MAMFDSNPAYMKRTIRGSNLTLEVGQLVQIIPVTKEKLEFHAQLINGRESIVVSAADIVHARYGFGVHRGTTPLPHRNDSKTYKSLSGCQRAGSAALSDLVPADATTSIKFQTRLSIFPVSPLKERVSV